MNAQTLKFAVLLGAVTLVASVYCEEDPMAEQNELLNTVLTLDRGRQAVAYVSALCAILIPAFFYRMYNDRVPDPRIFFGAVAITVVGTLFSFGSHLSAGRVHAMYLSGLILCLSPTLTLPSLLLISWLLNKYGPTKYAEIIFLSGNSEVQPTGPLEENAAVTTALTSFKKSFKTVLDTAKAAAAAAAQGGQAQQQGPLELDEETEKKITDEIKKLMKLLDGNSVSVSDCENIRAAIEGVLVSKEIKGSQAFGTFLEKQFIECDKVLKKLGSKHVKESFKYLQGLELPSKADMSKLKELDGHLKILHNNMPSREEEPSGRNARTTAMPAMDMEMDMKMDMEPQPVIEKVGSKTGSTAGPSAGPTAEKEISFTPEGCRALLAEVYQKIVIHVTSVYGGPENAAFTELRDESIKVLSSLIGSARDYAVKFLRENEEFSWKFGQLMKKVDRRMNPQNEDTQGDGGEDGERKRGAPGFDDNPVLLSSQDQDQPPTGENISINKAGPMQHPSVQSSTYVSNANGLTSTVTTDSSVYEW